MYINVNDPFGLNFAGFFTVILAVTVSVFLCLTGYKQDRVASEFLKTAGIVESSNIYKDSGDYKIWIVVSFNVDGVEYQTDKFDFVQAHPFSSDINKMRALKNVFHAGKPVPVYYNPDDPSEAVLSKAKRGVGAVVMSMFCLLLSMLAWLLATLRLRKIKKSGGRLI